MALTKVIGDGLGGTNDLTVDTTTLTVDATNNRVGVGTATPLNALHVEGSNAADIFLKRADLTNKAWLFNIQSSTGDLNIKSRNDDGSASSTSMIIYHDGYVTKPNQSCFNAILSGHITISTLNAYNTLVFGTARFDQNSDYNTSNGIFTAPVTGRYLFTTSLYLFNSLDSAATYYYLNLETSNETVDVYFTTGSFLNSDTNGFNMQASSIQDLSAGDTAKVKLYQSGGSAQTQIAGGHSHFSGALIC